MGRLDRLLAKVVVRRVARGAEPFGWEIHLGDSGHPVVVSPARFTSMELAHHAGQAGLESFLRSGPVIAPPVEPRPLPPAAQSNRHWRRQSRG